IYVLVSTGITIFLLGAVVSWGRGLAFRFPSDVLQLTRDYDPKPAYRFKRCFLDTETQDSRFFAAECLDPASSTGPLVFLWGDSHAAHLFPGLKKLQQARQFRLAQFTATSCPPFAGDRTVGSGWCFEIRQHIEEVITAQKPPIVVLGTRWTLYDDLET